MEQVRDRHLYPYAFRCCEGEELGFLPYEFSSTPVQVPAQSFLSALGQYLRDHGLDEIIAITQMEDRGKRWVEQLSSDGSGTIAVAASEEQECWDDGYVLTEWVVMQDGEEARVIGVKACDDKDPAHTRP